MPVIDTTQTVRFLSALSSSDLHTFQTLDDSGAKRKGLIGIQNGRFEKLADKLASLNLKGAGVFVMVNQGDGKGRCKENVTGARALFVDLDNAPLEPVLAAKIPPRIIVETSPGKWHCFWPVVDMPLSMWTAAQKKLAETFGGDPSVNDINRVCRLPGFIHNKRQSVVSQLIRCEDRPLTWAEMVDAFGLTHHTILPNTVPEGERNNTIYKLAKAARAKGVPFEAQLAKARLVNSRRFASPLSEQELARTVANAYSGAQAGDLRIPLEVHDHPEFMALSYPAQIIVGLAYRKLDGFNNGNFSLPWSEYKERFPREASFEKWRAEAAASPFLRVTFKSPKRTKGQTGKPKPNLYALAIPPQTVPYGQGSIPPQTVPPEALQLCAVRASESLDSTAAIFDGRVTPNDNAQSGATDGVAS